MIIQDTLQLEFNTVLHADIFLQSFLPEAEGMPMKRAKWQFQRTDDSRVVKIHITAQDAIAYRATINSLIQLAYVVETTINIINNGP